MKIKVCPKNHRVYPEINNPEIDYQFMCPQCDENYLDMEVREVEDTGRWSHTVESSNGKIYIDQFGNVLFQDTTPECHKLVWFDLNEYKEFWGKDYVEFHLDILDLRGIFETGEELIWSRYRERLTNNA